jgi:general stress protein 26
VIISDDIKEFIRTIPIAFVASTDESGHPHLAAGTGLEVRQGRYLNFENWFCTTTLRNVARNPNIAVAVTTADGRAGYQFLGRVSRSEEEAIIDGYAPKVEKPGTPQALIRMIVEVEEIMEFSAGVHTDTSLAES